MGPRQSFVVRLYISEFSFHHVTEGMTHSMLLEKTISYKAIHRQVQINHTGWETRHNGWKMSLLPASAIITPLESCTSNERSHPFLHSPSSRYSAIIKPHGWHLSTPHPRFSSVSPFLRDSCSSALFCFASSFAAHRLLPNRFAHRYSWPSPHHRKAC